MTSEDGLKNYEARTRIHNYPEVIYQMRFMTVNNGWLETFKEIKTRARAKLDLDNYKRDDLKWYDDLFIHQFAYAYGKEAYDYETGKFRLAERLTPRKGKPAAATAVIITILHHAGKDLANRDVLSVGLLLSVDAYRLNRVFLRFGVTAPAATQNASL